MFRNLCLTIQSILLLLILATTGTAIQLALRPLYGSVAPVSHHTASRAAIYLLSILWPYHRFPRLDDSTSLTGLACFITCLPYLTYTLGKWTGKLLLTTNGPGDAAIGASLTVLLTTLPPILLGISLLRRWNAQFLSGILSGPLVINAAISSVTNGLHIMVEGWLREYFPIGRYFTSSNMFLILTGCLVAWVALMNRKGGRRRRSNGQTSSRHLMILTVPVFLGVLSTRLPPIVSPDFPYVRQSLVITPEGIKPASVRVLARQESTTGLILVGEYVEESFRFLRADHSLLGGRWIGAKVPADSRSGLGDSIYSAFLVQEAIRLVEPENRNTDPREQERALFIGLGVGIAAESFMAHKINTTVVEIDPVVYEYARVYFGLPKPDGLFLEDARLWLKDQRALRSEEKYDYIIHDCFSGGGVPDHIFTSEFWRELKNVMKEDGVIAVNFAGKLGSNSSRAIYLTLEASFGQCRGYHDHLHEFDDELPFFNIVFFCTSTSWNFREASLEDYLGSLLRKHMLTDFAHREIPRSRIIGNVEGDEWILYDGSNKLKMWEEETALDHWKVMRQVLPDIFWETY